MTGDGPNSNDKVTAEQVVAEVEAVWRSRQDMGLRNRATNLLFEPKNIFDPRRRRAPKKDAVVVGTLLLLGVLALVYFNLAALPLAMP